MGEHRPYKPGVTGSSPVPPTSQHADIIFGGVVQLVRTPACHAGGREFESRRSRHNIKGLQILSVSPFFVAEGIFAGIGKEISDFIHGKHVSVISPKFNNHMISN